MQLHGVIIPGSFSDPSVHVFFLFGGLWWSLLFFPHVFFLFWGSLVVFPHEVP